MRFELSQTEHQPPSDYVIAEGSGDIQKGGNDTKVLKFLDLLWIVLEAT